MSRFRRSFLTTAPLLLALMMSTAFAEELAPDALIKAVSTEVIAAIRQDPAIQAGDPRKIAELVEAKIVPHFDFRRVPRIDIPGPRAKHAAGRVESDRESHRSISRQSMTTRRRSMSR